MALFSISNVKIVGIAACVPQKIGKNVDNKSMSAIDIEKFIDTTGVEERRLANIEQCTSDLCIAAAQKVINDTGINREEIDLLVFVSQTTDYKLPISSAIIQDKLGLTKACVAFDIPLGCSGYVYGLGVISSLMNTGGFRKGLLLAGDTISKEVSQTDKSASPLFGDAGTATIIEFNTSSPAMVFDMGTDGSGYEAIIIPEGGSRNPFSTNSLLYEEVQTGVQRNKTHVKLEGMDVFTFGISQAPKTVKSLMDHFLIKDEDIDFYVFHQANKLMNDRIAKKLKLRPEKVPSSLRFFGNTSSATIPLTIITELKNILKGNVASLILCGFGVGLSWGTAYVKLEDCIYSDLIEL